MRLLRPNFRFWSQKSQKVKKQRMQENPENAEECKRMQKEQECSFYLFTFLPLKC